MIEGIHRTGLSVTDLEAAISFFATSGSFELVSRSEIQDNEPNRTALNANIVLGQSAILKGPSGFLEVFQFDLNRDASVQQHGVFDAGIRHICIQHGFTKVSALFDAYVEAGSSWHARPSGLGTGALYCYVRDPEGNVIELEGVRWGEEATVPPWYTHTAIVTPDIARLTTFYEALTGVEAHRRGSFGPNDKLDTVAGLKGVKFDGAWIRLGHGEIEMWEYHEPRTHPVARRNATDLGWNLLCFQVDDITDEHRRLTDMGIELHGDATSNAHGSSLYGRDPDGNIFQLFQPAAANGGLSIQSLTGREHLRDLQRAYAS